jgi:membrane-associated phospholipid phosphatase
MQQLIRRNWLFYTLYALLLFWAFVCQLKYSKTELFEFFNANRSLMANTFYYYLTALGDGWSFIMLILLFAFIKYRYALAGAATYALSSLIAQGLKRLIFAGEPRPLEYFKNTSVKVYTAPENELLLFNSFPSGHATTVFAIACLLSLLVTNKKTAVLFLIIAVLTGFSRIYLGQHFLADITTGSFIGVISATFCYYWIMPLKSTLLEKSLNPNSGNR